jgi:hypothetical protein
MIRQANKHIKGLTGASVTAHADNLTDVHDWLRDAKASRMPKDSPAWSGMLHGDTKSVPRAERLMDKIAAETLLRVHQKRAVASPVGSLACVPDYLAGSPTPMRLRRPTPSPAPITLVLDITTSAAIPKEVIATRGAATLALVQLLIQAGHAVQLMAGFAAQPDLALGMSNSNVLFSVTMESAPLDIARAAWTLTSEEAQRHMCFSAGYEASAPGSYGHSIFWPKTPAKARDWVDTEGANMPLQRSAWAQALDLPESGLLVIPPLFGYHKKHYESFLTDAGAADWVTARYAEILALEKKDDWS